MIIKGALSEGDNCGEALVMARHDGRYKVGEWYGGDNDCDDDDDYGDSGSDSGESNDNDDGSTGNDDHDFHGVCTYCRTVLTPYFSDTVLELPFCHPETAVVT